MHLDNASGPVPLTSGSTLFLTRLAPWLVSVLAFTVAVLAWLGLLGPESADPALRWVMLGVAAAATTGQYVWLRRFREVWLDGDYLVVGDPRRGTRVRLQDVASVEETRLQKFKAVKVRLRHRMPFGDTIHFIPRGREGWLLPWLSSPVASELRARVEALGGGAPAAERLPRGIQGG